MFLVIFSIFLVSLPPSCIVSTDDGSCSGGFDVYFILDRSQSVSNYNFQNKTVQFVEDIVKHLISPKLRVSISVFSSNTELILPITKDRAAIEEGINKLKSVTPSGTTYLLSSLKTVLSQLQDKGSNTASVVVILTDGDIYDDSTSIEKTNELQKVGASIFTVGVEGYKLEQLEKLASKPSSEYVFTVENYQALQTISEKIINKACVEVTNINPNTICRGDSPTIRLSGKGFVRLNDKSKIKCRFIINSTYNVVRVAEQVTDTSLQCTGPPTDGFKNDSIGVQVSVNGITYITSDRSITVLACQQGVFTVAVVGIFTVLLLLALVLLWWFWKLLPCASSKKRHHDTTLLSVGDQATNQEPASSPTKTKWAPVDASYYGGGGVGGVKPMRVAWGEKGCTESGDKLMKTPDAKIISPSQENNGTNNAVPGNTSSAKPPSCFSRFQKSMNGFFARISDLRPQRGGRSRLYSSVSER